MIIHNSCKSPVYVDKTQNIQILSSFIVLYGSIKLTTADITIKKGSPLTALLVCPNCGPVKIPELSCACGNCGHIHPLSSIFRVSKVAGYYCTDCCNEFFAGVPKKALAVVLTSAPVKGEDK